MPTRKRTAATATAEETEVKKAPSKRQKVVETVVEETSAAKVATIEHCKSWYVT